MNDFYPTHQVKNMYGDILAEGSFEECIKAEKVLEEIYRDVNYYVVEKPVIQSVQELLESMELAKKNL